MKLQVIYRHVASCLTVILFLILALASFPASLKDCDPLTTSVSKTYDITIHVLDRLTNEPLANARVEASISFYEFNKEGDNPCRGSLDPTGSKMIDNLTGLDGTTSFSSPTYTFTEATEHAFLNVDVSSGTHFGGAGRGLLLRSSSPNRVSLYLYFINKGSL